MTPQQIDLVKATVPVLRENGVALTGYFYNRMLGNNPELKENIATRKRYVQDLKEKLSSLPVSKD